LLLAGRCSAWSQPRTVLVNNKNCLEDDISDINFLTSKNPTGCRKEMVKIDYTPPKFSY
jgi:hypothetical protein